MARIPKRPPKANIGLTEAHIEKALRQTGGIQRLAAAKLGCSRSNISNRIAKSPRLQALLYEVEEETLDLAEATLINAIKNGDLRATTYYLNSKGKRRGYGPNFVMPTIAAANLDSPSASETDIALVSVMSVQELEALHQRLSMTGPPVIEGTVLESTDEPAVRGRKAAS